MHESDADLSSALEGLLEPLVKLMIRNGVPHGAFAELAKAVYVRVAEEEERIAGRKQTVSRMSVLTGLNRKEVSRLRKLPAQLPPDGVARHHRAARVITAWLRDERYLDASGAPRPLRLDAAEGEASFAELVRRYSGDVPARALRDELERVDAVRVDGERRVHLNARGYVPRAGEAEKLQILGTDVAGLIATIRHNLDAGDGERLFQRKVFYDNLQEEALPALRELAAAEGQQLLELLDRWMSARDLDANPNAEGSAGCRAGIGIYYFEEPPVADVSKSDEDDA